MSIFGHCLAAPGTKPDHYHSLCRREYVDQYGVRHVCGCPQHELDDQKALQTRGNDVSAWDNVSPTKDGPARCANTVIRGALPTGLESTNG